MFGIRGINMTFLIMEKITSQEMANYVGRHIRKLSPQLKGLQYQGNVAAVMQIIVSYMRELCQKKKFSYLQRILSCVGVLYQRGDQAIKQNVEYLFMHCLTRMDHLCNAKQWGRIIAQLPKDLKEVYIIQHIK